MFTEVLLPKRRKKISSAERKHENRKKENKQKKLIADWKIGWKKKVKVCAVENAKYGLSENKQSQ